MGQVSNFQPLSRRGPPVYSQTIARSTLFTHTSLASSRDPSLNQLLFFSITVSACHMLLNQIIFSTQRQYNRCTSECLQAHLPNPLCVPQIREIPGAEGRRRQQRDVPGPGEAGEQVSEHGALRQRHQIRQVLHHIRESEGDGTLISPLWCRMMEVDLFLW